MLKLLKYLKPYLWQTIALVVLIAVQVECTLLLPTLMADIVNQGIATQDITFIWQTGLKMFALAVAGALCALIANYFSAKVGTALARDLRADLFAKVLSFSTTETKRFSTASLITRTTNDVSQVQNTIIMILSLLVRAPLMSIGAIIQAFLTAPNMTWIIAVAVVAIACVVFTIMSIVVPKFKLFQKLLDKITLLTRENLTGLRVIRAFNNEPVEQKKFAAANSELTKTIIFVNKIVGLLNPLTNFIFNGVTLLCIWIGITLITDDITYLGNMMAFAQYVTQIIMSFLMLSLLFVMLPRANVSAHRINEILSVRNKIRFPKATAGTPNTIPSVRFDDVDFAYDDADEKVLSDVSFTAKAGEVTAFIGSTGSGKSTLINLVPRFYEATSGHIYINDLDIKKYSSADLMSRIGYVPQRGILFAGDVNSNITFGNRHATKEQIELAAEISQSAEFISQLPKEYNAHVSQGGKNLSGGQKQRLSIARAIAKNPEIYIFDDSFSALDMKTDAKLRAALKPITKDAVVLIVAQRVSTIKDADQIIVMDNGRAVGKGTHQKLLKSCKVYREIVKSQLSEAEFNQELKNVK